MPLKCFSKANMLLSTEKKWNPTFCLLMERYLSGGERRWFALWIWLLYELPFVSFHLFSILALFRTANAYSHAHKTYAATIQQRQLSSSRSSSNSTNCTGKNNFSVQVSYLLPTFCVQWAGFLVFFLYRHRRRCCCCCWESKKYTQRPIFSLAFRCKFIHYIYISLLFVANDMNGLKMGASALVHSFALCRWLHITNSQGINVVSMKRHWKQERKCSGFNGMCAYK